MLTVPSFHRTDYDDEYLIITTHKHRSKPPTLVSSPIT